MSKSKDTRYFSKTVNGDVVTMSATAPADVVRYTYDGWRDVTDEVTAAQAAAKATPAPDPGKTDAAKTAEPAKK